jgi:hypothetical protein
MENVVTEKEKECIWEAIATAFDPPSTRQPKEPEESEVEKEPEVEVVVEEEPMEEEGLSIRKSYIATLAVAMVLSVLYLRKRN